MATGIGLITRGFISGTGDAPVVVKPIVPFEVTVSEPDKIVVTLKDD